MKRLLLLCISVFSICCGAYAQSSNTTATVSYDLGMGQLEFEKTTISSWIETEVDSVPPSGCVTSKHGGTTCSIPAVPGHDSTIYDTTITCVGTPGFMSMKYNYSANTLTNFPSNTACSPTFIPFPTGPSPSGTTTISGSSICYDPANQYEYFFVTEDTTISGVGSVPNTYVYSWPIGTCPTSLFPIAEFPKQNLLPTFDNSGNAWAVGISNNSPYTLSIQELNFTATSVTTGPVIPLNTGSAPNITAQDGDFIFTPTGQMFLVYNNEEFAINYQAYASSPSSITATYVSTLAVPHGDYLVGLGYGGGNMLGAISNGKAFSCTNTPIYDVINMLTGTLTPITYGGGFSSNDNAYVTSGIGAAKSLVSVTPTSVAGQYTVVYDIYVQDYGNYPISNVQVTDNLGAISLAQNVVSVSTAFVGTPPPASYNLVIDPNFNGTDSINLLKPWGTLPNYPVAQANFTIQVTVVLNNIAAGIVYENTAVVTGTGFNGDALTDTSTNGTNPNPIGDGRPDDPGEDIPTPFVLELTAQSAPCPTLPQVLFQETFGTASGMTTALPAGGTTQYTGTTTAPIPTNDYTISNNADIANSKNKNDSALNWIYLKDHTTGTGDMMLVNGNNAQNVIYQTTVSNLCTDLLYSFNAYVANINDTAAITFCNATLGYQPPSLEFQMVDALTGSVLANLGTGPILTHSWTSYGMRIALPAEDASGSVALQIVNVGGGSCGNAFAVDDISFGLCNAEPNVVIDGGHAGCLDSSTTLAATLSDSSVFTGTITYQWLDSTAGSPGWDTITGANFITYTIPIVTLATPTYYKVNVAPQGESFKACSYTSPNFLMIFKTPSTPVTGGTLTASPTSIGCTPSAVTLTASGYTLGSGAEYVWYSGTCGVDTLEKTTTNTISVNPTLTTTYNVQVTGACNTTSCVPVTVTDVCALPTDLIYFNGSYSTGITTLTWEVTDNENLTGFYVERSVNGIDFTIIDSLPATGENGEASYNLADNVSNVDAGTITYRLILRQKGGGSEESPIVAINKPLANVTDVVVYPNPASNQLTIAINSDQQQQMSYSVIAMTGQVLLSGSQVLVRGQNSVNVNEVQVLPSGAYIVRIQLQDGLAQKKLIIQK